MANLISEMARLAQKDEDAVRRIAAGDFRTNEVRAARILIRMLERMEARDDDVIIRTAENGKKYAIDPDSGKIASGPMKGTKVSGNGKQSKKKLTSARSGVTMRTDLHGNKWDRPTRMLPKKEYAKVIHEIDDRFSSFYKGKLIGSIVTNPGNGKPAYTYTFQIREYDDYPEYNIVSKRRNKE